ncbi:MAG: hypothetical protein OEZ02_08115, partial [Anaerolineae bacterium]|nr:hypothetical protein [Anaerolineae bacterium]
VKFPPFPPICAILSLGSCRGALLCARLTAAVEIAQQSPANRQVRHPPMPHRSRGECCAFSREPSGSPPSAAPPRSNQCPLFHQSPARKMAA